MLQWYKRSLICLSVVLLCSFSPTPQFLPVCPLYPSNTYSICHCRNHRCGPCPLCNSHLALPWYTHLLFHSNQKRTCIHISSRRSIPVPLLLEVNFASLRVWVQLSTNLRFFPFLALFLLSSGLWLLDFNLFAPLLNNNNDSDFVWFALVFFLR